MDELRALALLARSRISMARLRGATRPDCPPAHLVSDPAAFDPSTRARLERIPAARIDADLRWLERHGARLVGWTAPDYPARLALLPDAPAVLYVLGRPGVIGQAQLAMVGARAASPGGIAIARELAFELARTGLAITSGLAHGIDAASHEGALAASGVTIAVCAHGLDLTYPADHRALARRIAAVGALVSELPPGAAPAPWCFAARNRLVSGLALGTLVVEARRDSGSLVTAHWARRQGRCVLAVPGSIRGGHSAGCHALLRSGATLVERASDVTEALGFRSEKQALIPQPDVGSSAGGPPARLDKACKMLLDALGFEPASINTLVERTGLPSESLTSMLLILELGGRVAPHPGGGYCRLS
jgi:DNA processing protein